MILSIKGALRSHYLEYETLCIVDAIHYLGWLCGVVL